MDLITAMKFAAPHAAAFMLTPEHYRLFVRTWLDDVPDPRNGVPTVFENVPVVVCPCFWRHSYTMTGEDPPNLMVLATGGR